MQKMILIRFGDMMLKGRNIGYFIKRVRMHLVEKLKGLETTCQFTHDRIFINYQVRDEQDIVKRLKEIQGIHSFSIVYVAKPELDDIIDKAIYALDHDLQTPGKSLKIETRRTDKSFPMTSLEITQHIASRILSQAKKKYVIDVRQPDDILEIDLRKDVAYIYSKREKGMGGFPYGTAGKGLLMMSGGIDSPVSAYLAMKQGIEVELIHFESTPMTPLESVQKVIDLAKKLAKYTPTQTIKLHLVPFTALHEAILNHIFDPYIITVMRRMMYRIAEQFTKKKKILCLINGESVGQVASQTLNSMAVVEAVTMMPILRPVITYDKQEIVDLSKMIDTYDISIRPFNDCCSIYVPKRPATKPMTIYAVKYEREIPYETFIKEALEKTVTIEVQQALDFEISAYGFTVKEALDHYMKEKGDFNDHIENK
jgi:tRNA uracil 4-sulfurtransferase